MWHTFVIEAQVMVVVVDDGDVLTLVLRMGLYACGEKAFCYLLHALAHFAHVSKMGFVVLRCLLSFKRPHSPF